MPEPRPPMVEVIEDLTADHDGSGQDWEVVDGPHVFPDRVVAYVRQAGPFRDTLRIQVTVHESGEAREVAQNTLASMDEEWARLEPYVGRRVIFRGEPAYLERIGRKPNTGIEVAVQYVDPPLDNPRPDRATGWAGDVTVVED